MLVYVCIPLVVSAKITMPAKRKRKKCIRTTGINDASESKRKEHLITIGM
jgi:hypothetical protein